MYQYSEQNFHMAKDNYFLSKVFFHTDSENIIVTKFLPPILLEFSFMKKEKLNEFKNIFLAI